jgi:murein DD-endopeptidase MepM/ murein hydrolase activator NlpD
MRDRDDEAVNEDESELPAAPRRGLLFGNGDSSRLSWPLTNGRFTSGFGMRGKRHFHKGIDVVAPRGSAIYAAAPGRVTYAGRRRGYGLVVTVEHDMVKTVYAHMSKIFAKKGQVVDRRTVIGAVGSTGRASGAHVHFEVRDLETDKPMDPMLFLPPQNLLSQVSHLSNKAG